MSSNTKEEKTTKLFDPKGPPPFETVGLFTFLRTYSRRHIEDDPDSTIESWEECLTRVVLATNKQLNVGFTEDELKELFSLLYNLKCSVAGRFLWQLGTKTVDKMGLMSLQNCAFIVADKPIEPFTWIMNFLMLGSGCGYRLTPEDVDKLPVVKKANIVRKETKDADFIVPDSREGWVKLLGKVLKAHFYSGKDFNYSCVLIRSRGAPIKSFGGVSSGPEVLCEGIEKISKIFTSRVGQKLRSVDVLDVMNLIGQIVISGNVRRCLPWYAKVHTDKGLVNIKDVKVGDKVLTSDGYKSVKNKFSQEKQKLIKIITEDGEFECTRNHKMAVLSGFDDYSWREAGELKIGDRLMTTRIALNGEKMELPQSDKIKVPTLDEDLAWALGMISHSGYEVNKEVYIPISEKLDDSKRELLCLQFKRFGFSIDVEESYSKGYNLVGKYNTNLDNYFTFYVCTIGSNVDKGLIEHNIPYYILKNTVSIRLAFLAGIADAKGVSRPLSIVVSHSLSYVKDIQNLLYSCGIENRLEKLDEYGYSYPFYSVSLITSRSRELFNSIPELVTPIGEGKISHNCNTYCNNLDGTTVDNRDKNRHTDRLNICPVKVIAIRICGEEEIDTYDIEVEDKHEFFCNGYLTHNSAQIAIGDCEDSEYLRAKRWDLGNIPNYRCYSNNSVICNDINKILDNDEFWEGYNGNGEPYGLINLELSRKCGRLGDTEYPDPDVAGYNPSLRAGTKIITKDGIVPIESLEGKEFSTKNLNGEWKEASCWLSGKGQRLYKVKLNTNMEYYATKEHKWPVMHGNTPKKVTTEELKKGDVLPYFQHSMLFKLDEKRGYKDGYEKGKEVGNQHEDFPEDIWVCGERYRQGFINGLMSSNIRDIMGYSNLLKSKNMNLISNLQELLGFYGIISNLQELLGFYGIISTKGTCFSGNVYTLTILNMDHLKQLNPTLSQDDVNMNMKVEVTIKSVELTDIYEDVWDIRVEDETHCFQLSGCITGNCGEQSLCDAETCCLAEIYLPNVKSKDELFKCAEYLYRICKHSLTLPCPDSERTEEIVHKNMRIGIGVTGYLQATEEQKQWLSPCYKFLREYDSKYSIAKGFPRSIKLTTCKPSGCSRKDMLVNTTQGLLRLDEIGDVNGEDWQDIKDIQVFTDDNRTEMVTKFYVNGDVETRKIITEDGMELESSLNHRYRVVTGDNTRIYKWKKVLELEIGDRLAVKLGNHPSDIVTELKKVDGNPFIQQPDVLTPDLSLFIGLFYRFGSVNESEDVVKLITKDKIVSKWLSTPLSDSFGLINMTTNILNPCEFNINSNAFVEWLKINGIWKKGEELTVPKIIRTSNRENTVQFIAGLRIGCINNPNYFKIFTETKTFSRQLLCLCRSIGYNVFITNTLVGWILSSRTDVSINRCWNGFWLDPISSITESKCETFDIEVENAHHYRIGSIISHNTLSLLAGVTSGVHPGYSQYYIRRIRIASESKLISVAKEHGYHCEYEKKFDGTNNTRTMVLSFPYKLPDGTVFADECSAVQQLEYVKRLQTDWSDNSVSCTVTYKKDELGSIKEWLKENYNDGIKTVSFLLHSGHGFVQAPLEPITKEAYEEMVKNTRPITDVSGICFVKEDEEFIGESECVGNHCPLR